MAKPSDGKRWRIVRFFEDLSAFVGELRAQLLRFGFVVACVLAGFAAGRWSLPFEGEVTSVREQVTGPGTFDVHGTVTGLPAGDRLWLATAANGLMWPKVPLPSVEPQSLLRRLLVPRVTQPWVATFSEGRSDGFSVLLLAMGSSADDDVREWLARGKVTGSHPGFQGRIPGARTLAVFRVSPGPRVSLDGALNGIDRENAPFEVPMRIRVANAAGLRPYLVVEDDENAWIQPAPRRVDAEAFLGFSYLGERDVQSPTPRSYLVYAVLSREPHGDPGCRGRAPTLLDRESVVTMSESVSLRRR